MVGTISRVINIKVPTGSNQSEPLDNKLWKRVNHKRDGRDWGQEEKETTEDEMAGWHHWFDGCESEWTPGFGDGQGGLACCNSWGRKESDTTEWLNWTEHIYVLYFLWFFLILYFWESNLYSRFLIFAFWYLLSILYL